MTTPGRTRSARLRLSAIGLTGCGKSTFASFVDEVAAQRRLTCCRLKLAQPLYDLQARVYEACGMALEPGAQDQVLMESLAQAMRRIRPASLVDHFLDRLARTEADVVVNDDLRDPHVDAVALRAHGFRIVRVTADPAVRQQRLAGRGDLTRAERSTAEIDLIEPDALIDNSGDLARYRDAARNLVEGWL